MQALATTTIAPGHGAKIPLVTLCGLAPMAFAARFAFCRDMEILAVGAAK
jgi:hypothetical protein